MKLKSLSITLNHNWDDNPGKYTGEMEYEGQKGSVKLVLDPKVSDALLLCIGETVTQFASEAALEVKNSLIQSVEEAKKPLAIEA